MDDSLTSYLTQLLPARENWVVDLEEQAKADHVPIMDQVSIDFLLQLIRMSQPETILEIGTAIGYSALRMLQANPSAQIVTIERDEQRFQQAVNNIKNQQKQDKITVVYGDALEKSNDIIAKGPYDLLFIDAAKGQYQRFFELYSQAVSKGGVIISDNVLFKGYVADPEKDHPKFTKLARKIRQYNEWLMTRSDYKTSIVPIGDGVAISIKK